MKIVAMLPVYNEADVVGQVINWLVKQGMSLVVIDNGSSDDSFDICSNYLRRGVLHIEQVPTRSFKFQWLLERLYTTALRYAPDWAIICAADEFPESPYRGMSLKKAVEHEAQRGYNIIQFNRFEFWPTEKDHLNEEDVRSRVKYYTWDRAYQFRCWRVVPGVTVRRGRALSDFSSEYSIYPFADEVCAATLRDSIL